MWSKGNLNVSCTFRFKATGMQEYNRGMWYPNKKAPRGSILDIDAQATRRGHGVWKDGVPLSPVKELV
jgi:hypothetical protein